MIKKKISFLFGGKLLALLVFWLAPLNGWADPFGAQLVWDLYDGVPEPKWHLSKPVASSNWGPSWWQTTHLRTSSDEACEVYLGSGQGSLDLSFEAESLLWRWRTSHQDRSRLALRTLLGTPINPSVEAKLQVHSGVIRLSHPIDIFPLDDSEYRRQFEKEIGNLEVDLSSIQIGKTRFPLIGFAGSPRPSFDIEKIIMDKFGHTIEPLFLVGGLYVRSRRVADWTRIYMAYRNRDGSLPSDYESRRFFESLVQTLLAELKDRYSPKDMNFNTGDFDPPANQPKWNSL